jgi:hypothetical protein
MDRSQAELVPDYRNALLSTFPSSLNGIAPGYLLGSARPLLLRQGHEASPHAGFLKSRRVRRMSHAGLAFERCRGPRARRGWGVRARS